MIKTNNWLIQFFYYVQVIWWNLWAGALKTPTEQIQLGFDSKLQKSENFMDEIDLASKVKEHSIFGKSWSIFELISLGIINQKDTALISTASVILRRMSSSISISKEKSLRFLLVLFIETAYYMLIFSFVLSLHGSNQLIIHHLLSHSSAKQVTNDRSGSECSYIE